jgi:hypothetical protein
MSVKNLGFLGVNHNRKLMLFQQISWWKIRSRGICEPEEVLDFRQNPVGISTLFVERYAGGWSFI